MEETTTIGAVAESQQNLQQPAGQVETQPTQPAEPTNPTWTSSGTGEQPTQPETPKEVAPQEGEPTSGKTLEEIAKEQELDKNKQESEDALQGLVKEAVKDLPPETDDPNEPKAQEVDTAKSEKEADELKKQVDEIENLKEAEVVAKKLFLAYERERRWRILDNQMNADTIDNLKELIKQLNVKLQATDNDPRVVKLDDEAYALYRLRSAYKSENNELNKKNLSKFYLTEIAIMNPEVSANKLIEFINKSASDFNTIGQNNGTYAGVEPPKKPVYRPKGIPSGDRGIY